MLGLLTAAPAAPAADVPRFVGAACPVPLPDGVRQGRDVRCGHVAVPLDHRRPERGEIRLAVAVLRARGEARRSDAVLRLAGGPGEKLVAALSRLKGPQNVVGGRERDVVLFDQRGVGCSRPALDVCAAWGVPARPRAARRAVSAVPALVATSRFDPITPPSYGARALRGLANGVAVRGAATGHAPLEGLAACGLRIVQAFLDAPGVRPDARCAAQPVEFVAPEAAFGAAGRALRAA